MYTDIIQQLHVQCSDNERAKKTSVEGLFQFIFSAKRLNYGHILRNSKKVFRKPIFKNISSLIVEHIEALNDLKVERPEALNDLQVKN